MSARLCCNVTLDKLLCLLSTIKLNEIYKILNSEKYPEDQETSLQVDVRLIQNRSKLRLNLRYLRGCARIFCHLLNYAVMAVRELVLLQQ